MECAGGRVPEDGDTRGHWDGRIQYLKSLRVQFRGEDTHAGHVSAGPRKTRGAPFTYEVVGPGDDRRCLRRFSRRPNRPVTNCDEAGELEFHQVGDKSRHACWVTPDKH